MITKVIFNAGNEGVEYSESIIRFLGLRANQYTKSSNKFVSMPVYEIGDTMVTFGAYGFPEALDYLHSIKDQEENVKMDKLIFIGAAGSFKDDINLGDFIIPTEVYFNDLRIIFGEIRALPDEKIATALEDKIKSKTNVTVHRAPTCSSFYVYDPESPYIKTGKRWMTVAIDMEAAVVLNFCEKHNIDAAALLYCSDTPEKPLFTALHEVLDPCRDARMLANKIAWMTMQEL